MCTSVRGGDEGRPTVRTDVEMYDRPAEGTKLGVDVEYQSAVTPTPFGRPGLVDSASFRAPAIHHDLYRGIACKRAPEISVELPPITRDDHQLLRDCLRAFLPALGTSMELRQQRERPWVEEAGQWNPGVPAARGTRRRPDVEAGLTIEAECHVAKG
jgi:hypothetical protein